jgi:hypothetical protein
MEAEPELGMSFALMAEVRPKRRCAPMKVLIGVDPHKGSVAVAAVDEVGKFVERASFSQNLKKALGHSIALSQTLPRAPP